MACSDITQGIGRQCNKTLGGVQKIYIFNNLEDPFTISADGSEATAMNILLTQSFEFDVTGVGNILEQNVVSSRDTFTSVNTQTITALLGGMSATKHATLNFLVQSRAMAVIKDRNSNYHAVGIGQDLNEGIDFNNVATTGGAQSDFNGYTLTGTSIVKDLAPILDSATVTAFLATVQANV